VGFKYGETVFDSFFVLGCFIVWLEEFMTGVRSLISEDLCLVKRECCGL
jgi:hypothetical protein